jgi:formylglycine-generating enzyme required for sulfatase activity
MSVDNLIGQTFGQCELRELLGVGGMGAVYRAYQKHLKREVAVKIISTALSREPGYRERFFREAETSAALENAHIVPIYDFGTQAQISYLVMRLLTGGSLADHLKQRSALPSLGETAKLVSQLAEALDYAHAQGVIHRDIKPNNVMFDNQGTAFIVDFGVAHLVQATTALTGTGTTLGTPLYMPPEQWRNEQLVPASDQYALAVMTYQLVTGRLPFMADTPHGLMFQHLSEMPTPPQVVRADVPEAVALVLQRALAKKPADRFPNVTAFAQAFQRAVAGREGAATGYFTAKVQRGGGRPISSSRPAPSASVAIPVYRQPAMWVAIIIIALLLVVVMLQSLPRGNEDGVERSATPQATAPETIAVVPSDTPTFTPTATPTLTAIPSPTTDSQIVALTNIALQAAAVVQTATAEQQNREAIGTAQRVQQLTQDAAATVSQSTLQAAQDAATAVALSITQAVLDQTLTAQAWTNTPMPTATDVPSPTALPTATSTTEFTPTPIPSGETGAPVTANAQWTPVVQNFDGVPMVLVPAGCFMMGSTNGGSDEQPVHEQCFDEAFWIDQTEVTNAQYAAFINAGGYTNTAYWTKAGWSWRQSERVTQPGCWTDSAFNQPDQPVVCVSWYEATAYSAWLSATSGVTFRLPTEAELEYAAQGPDGLEYPWGNEWKGNNVVWSDNSGGRTANVGSRPSGAAWVGALDMSGNVWEWVSSLYQPYPYSATDGREDVQADGLRVLRGGSWVNGRSDPFRCDYRLRNVPHLRDDVWGFRLALS